MNQVKQVRIVPNKFKLFDTKKKKVIAILSFVFLISVTTAYSKGIRLNTIISLIHHKNEVETVVSEEGESLTPPEEAVAKATPTPPPTPYNLTQALNSEGSTPCSKTYEQLWESSNKVDGQPTGKFIWSGTEGKLGQREFQIFPYKNGWVIYRRQLNIITTATVYVTNPDCSDAALERFDFDGKTLNHTYALFGIYHPKTETVKEGNKNVEKPIMPLPHEQNILAKSWKIEYSSEKDELGSPKNFKINRSEEKNYHMFNLPANFEYRQIELNEDLTELTRLLNWKGYGRQNNTADQPPPKNEIRTPKEELVSSKTKSKKIR